MQKQAQQFIELLVSQELLAPEIVDELRRQVSESRTKLSAELLAKLLVDNGHLTKFQATKLIAELRDAAPTGGAGDDGDDAQADDELGFAPGDEAATDSVAKSNVAEVFIDDDDADLVQSFGEDDVVEVDAVDVSPEDVMVETARPTAAMELPSASALAGQDDFGAAPVMAKVVRPKANKANPYDSFRILGVGLILALFMVAGFFLIRSFWRGSAEKRLELADAAYEQRSYETSAKMYEDFSKDFPTNENASLARVRSALSKVRKDAENAPDPMVGLETALEVLPPVGSEAALKDQQSDLAGVLVGLATKFNERADKTEVTAARKSLMDEMTKLLDLIDNPQFVGTAQKDQQAPTLLRIQEDRKRILREINRDEQLADALKRIDEQLSEKNVLAAYDIRKQLTNEYPLLKTAVGLQQRVGQATKIQQELVTPGTLVPEISAAGIPPETGARFVLANRRGDTAGSLAGYVIYVKVKGAVFALKGDTGEFLWRKFVGRNFENDPIRLDDTPTSDVLVCDPELGTVSRLAAATGDIVWTADIGTPVHMPVVEGEEIFVDTFDGSVLSLDSVSGQTRWVAKLPQPTAVRPGVAFNKPSIYVPAEHSNLYVLSRADGSCNQVYYLDNQAGSISVPPVLLLGQLFVFENRSSDTASIRVFDLSDDGLIVGENQTLPPIDGNIVVPPQVDGRRLVVRTDLGAAVVLDVEPTAETKKVNEIASLPKSRFEPTVSTMVAEDNKLWTADTRLTRFDLQVTTSKLRSVWIKNDGDTFTTVPQKFGEVIVHTRILRRNRGVRVSAVNAETGDPIWETDLGVPVSLVVNNGGQFSLVSAGGAYYQFGRERLLNEPELDPGQGKPAMDFADPLQLADGSYVLLNTANANQLAYLAPAAASADKPLRLLSANFGRAEPTCNAIDISGQLGVGLSNGLFVLINANNGSQTATPYQLSIEPGQSVGWNTPVYLAGAKSLIAASDSQKLLRLAVGDSLRALAEIDLEHPLVGPLAPVGNRVAGIESTQIGDSLVFFDAISLNRGDSLPLSGRRVSGPFPLAGGCLVQTNAKLEMVGADGKRQWSVDFPNSELVAPPLVDSGKLIVATRAGQLWVLDATTGNALGSLDARQEFSSPPLLVGSAGVLVGSDEGAVLALPVPTTLMGAK